MRMLLFVAPIIQLTLFGVALSNDVKNIRLWAQIDSRDTVLQHVYEHAVASKWFLPGIEDRNADPFELLRAGKIDAALIPPPGGLTRALGRGDADLQLLVNATNVIQAQSVEGYLKNIVNRVVQDDLKVEPPELPVQFDVRVLYNPTLETSYFMVPGVMCILLCMMPMVLTSMSITREKELGTFEMLISAPVTASEVIYGKTIPYVVLGMATVPLILAVAVFGFGVPMRGSLLVLLIASFAFVCTDGRHRDADLDLRAQPAAVHARRVPVPVSGDPALGAHVSAREHAADHEMDFLRRSLVAFSRAAAQHHAQGWRGWFHGAARGGAGRRWRWFPCSSASSASTRRCNNETSGCVNRRRRTGHRQSSGL